MGGSQKSKGVTWASDEYLCQVRLFLSEESPSQVASSAQDHLQAKTSWAPVSDGMVSDENLPPGFEGPQSAYAWSINLSQIPVIKWKCPPKYALDDSSPRVVAGEESKEVEAQNKREMGNLEAIYPKPSDIPSDPPMLAGAEIASHYDQECPVIPVTPIEDEDVAAEMLNDSAALNTVPMRLQPQQTAPGTSSFDPDVLAAAQSALSLLMRNNDQGNMIDHELLIKVLSDPKLIEQLARNPGALTSTQPALQSIMQNSTATNRQGMAPSATQAVSLPASSSSHLMSRTNLHLPQVNNRPEFVAPAPGGGFYQPPNRATTLSPNARPLAHESVPAPNAPVTKDINYYKNLIQKHGGERQDSTTPHSGVHSNHQHLAATSNFRPPRDLKQKIMKPCMYFNTSRGCRNGANCAYQHDGSSQQRVNNSNPDSQNAKRMKMEREITGT